MYTIHGESDQFFVLNFQRIKNKIKMYFVFVNKFNRNMFFFYLFVGIVQTHC